VHHGDTRCTSTVHEGVVHSRSGFGLERIIASVVNQIAVDVSV
jgi:hypothetical protein